MFLDKLKSRRLIFLNLFLIVTSLKLYVDVNSLQRQIETTTCISEKKFPDDETPNVNIFDLNKSLEPKNVYDNIKCTQSTLYDVRTNLCIHDLTKDIFVSRTIWQTGLWERSQLVS